jgi:hypothetical protein
VAKERREGLDDQHADSTRSARYAQAYAAPFHMSRAQSVQPVTASLR